MGRYIRGGYNFEYEYLRDASLCDLAIVSRVGKCELFPEICFVGVTDGDQDLIFYLNGENDCIPVDNQEPPFDVFRDFFFSTQKYFINADMASLLDILEESNGIGTKTKLLKMMNEAETVYLSAQCYYTLKSKEKPILLEWVNTHLPPDAALVEADLIDSQKTDSAVTLLKTEIRNEPEKSELPLIALQILINTIRENSAPFVVHDEDVAWETPLILDGELVGPTTVLGEYDTPLF